MAKQKGIFKVKGTLDDVTFYKTKNDGFLIRQKSTVDGKRIATDPSFQRTRENNSEFGAAGSAGKLLRSAFKGLTINASDSQLVSRLVTEMIKVLQEDLVSLRGKRNVLDGETELLTGFEFNKDGLLSTTLFAPYVASIDRPTGALQVDVAPFIPTNMVSAPGGATHFKINAAGASIDFEKKVYVVDVQASAVLPWNNTLTTALSLISNVGAASTHPLFLVVGIEFFQEVNGGSYPLKNGAFNCLQIVKVSGI